MATTPDEIGNMLADMICTEGEVYDEVGRRIIANRIMAVISEWLPVHEQYKLHPVLVPMDDVESKRVGQDKMEFGMYVGVPIDDVPLDYLAGVADMNRNTWIKLTRYLRSDRIKRERMG